MSYGGWVTSRNMCLVLSRALRVFYGNEENRGENSGTKRGKKSTADLEAMQ